MKTLKTERSRILNSKDYSVFSINKLFKPAKKHLEDIIKLLEKKNLSKDLPIIVDENYNILDGKYRFLANKELGEPIYFKVAEVGDYIDFMAAKGTEKQLTPKDYCIMHLDKIDYRKFLDRCNELPFSFKSILAYIGDVNTRSQLAYREFKSGEFIYSKEINYKFDVVLEVLNEWRKIDTEYSLSMSEVDDLCENGSWIINDIIEYIVTDNLGYKNKFFKAVEMGYPYTPKFTEICNDLHFRDTYGSLISNFTTPYGDSTHTCEHLMLLDKLID